MQKLQRKIRLGGGPFCPPPPPSWIGLKVRVRSHESRNELKPVWDFISVETLTSVFSQLFSCVDMNWGEMKLKTVWISNRSFWPTWNVKPAWDFHVNIIYSKRNELAQTHWMLRLMRMCVWNSMPVWISYRSFRQKWNFISGNRISCKHHPKWNAHTCPSKYRVTLKYCWNETSCEENLFSRRFKISNRHEFISPLMWTYSKYNFNNWLSKNNFQFFFKVTLSFIQKQLFARAPQGSYFGKSC